MSAPIVPPAPPLTTDSVSPAPLTTDPISASDPSASVPNAPVAPPAPASTATNTATPTRRRERLASTLALEAPDTTTIAHSPDSGVEISPDSSEQPVEIIPASGSDTNPESGSETENNKELEPEVEKAIENMQQGRIQSPQEVVVRAETLPATPPHTMKQPVVVLPLSEKAMKKAQHRNITYSVRWLYEYCRRQIQKLQEMIVVYRNQ